MVEMTLKVRDGLTVWRRGDGTVVKQASNTEEAERLRREVLFLNALVGCGYTASIKSWEIFSQGHSELLLEDLGDGEPIREPWLLMFHAHGLLKVLDDHQIQHGDLTLLNIIVRRDVPYAIDFGEARWYWEDRPPKRPHIDAFHLWPAIASLVSVNSQ